MVGDNYERYENVKTVWRERTVIERDRVSGEVTRWSQRGSVVCDGIVLIGTLERGIVDGREFGRMFHDSHVNWYTIDYDEFLQWHGIKAKRIV